MRYTKKGCIQDAKFKIRCRDGQHGTPALASDNQLIPDPTFIEDKTIPFQFTIKMPPPRYYPMILERDKKGRIVTSKFLPMNYKEIRH